MAEIVDDIKEYAHLTRQYLDVRLETVKVRTKMVISDIISVMVLGVAIGAMLALALLIFSFGLAQTVGKSFHDPAVGYYVVGSIYIVMVIGLLIMGKLFLKRYIQNKILEKLDEQE